MRKEDESTGACFTWFLSSIYRGCMRVCLYVEKGRERERRAIQGVLKGFCGGCSMVALRSLPT